MEAWKLQSRNRARPSAVCSMSHSRLLHCLVHPGYIPQSREQVIGDASPDASKLMKREGVRSVPSFHYFKNGEKVEVVNGANAEAIEAAITKNMS